MARNDYHQLLPAPYWETHKFPKWNRLVTVLDEPRLMRRIPYFASMTKAEHKELAEDFARKAADLLDRHTALVQQALDDYGDQGSLISGVIRDHFPDSVKDELRYYAHGGTLLADTSAAHHQASGARKPWRDTPLRDLVYDRGAEVAREARWTPDLEGLHGVHVALDVVLGGQPVDTGVFTDRLLGEVKGSYVGDDGLTYLKVRYLNGEPWPFDPLAEDVRVLEREYDDASASETGGGGRFFAIELDPQEIEPGYQDDLPHKARFRDDLTDLARAEMERGRTYRRPRSAVDRVVEWTGYSGELGKLLDWMEQVPGLTRYAEIWPDHGASEGGENAERVALAHAANQASSSFRRGGAPRLTATSSREDVIRWLQWNDPNGAHTDSLAQAEDIDPYTADEAWDALAQMLQGV